MRYARGNFWPGLVYSMSDRTTAATERTIDLTQARVQGHLQRLHLPRIAAAMDGVAEQAAGQNWTYLGFLDQLLDQEISARYDREVTMETKLAHFPFLKTLDEFDFAFQPSLNERQVRELATVRFVAHGENVLLLESPGVGKTHLAIALPATSPSPSRATSSPTRSWPPPSLTGSCTTRSRSTSATTAIGCARSRKPASSPSWPSLSHRSRNR